MSSSREQVGLLPYLPCHNYRNKTVALYSILNLIILNTQWAATYICDFAIWLSVWTSSFLLPFFSVTI